MRTAAEPLLAIWAWVDLRTETYKIDADSPRVNV